MSEYYIFVVSDFFLISGNRKSEFFSNKPNQVWVIKVEVIIKNTKVVAPIKAIFALRILFNRMPKNINGMVLNTKRLGAVWG